MVAVGNQNSIIKILTSSMICLTAMSNVTLTVPLQRGLKPSSYFSRIFFEMDMDGSAITKRHNLKTVYALTIPMFLCIQDSYLYQWRRKSQQSGLDGEIRGLLSWIIASRVSITHDPGPCASRK